MIAGIGVDLTTLSRISQVHERFGERFARRILNDKELDQYLRHQYPERMLAKRFAIKEAAVKALGTGERDGVLHHVSVSDEGDKIAAFVILEKS